MDKPTVGDFLRDPDLLATTEPLNDRQLQVLGDVAVTVDPDLPLSDVVEAVLDTTEGTQA